jgi:hypothetical protein
MRVKAQQVSKKMDKVTWSRLNPSYNQNTIEIELDDYEEIDIIQGELSDNDETWPKGAPISDHAMVNHKILKKKSP